MKRRHTIEIELELDGPELSGFDPKLHHNYEFIHQNDDVVAQQVYNAFQMAIANHLISRVRVVPTETTLELNADEKILANEYSERERQEDYKESISLIEIAEDAGISKAVWSMGIPAKDIATKFLPGKIQFTYDTHGWGYDQKEKYLSPVYENPTYLTVWKEFDKAIKHSGDYHHVFLEDVIAVGVKGDVTIMDFSAGS